ncbi:HlyD family secretion protein [Scopulibacillus darangshiensis]|uniref:HlyD family secretion protein n=1 Tax=Scopulibacillus darangshiensis TaxID=442528 RepID=A0A4R2NEK8_9BACL|nr:HlyD family efflux transporter periplasmic adaptor subunit [Scopulibacillus darangshiensis]TCP19749.1 HlyD family secretion protein [Scopulibacillus darangshiensis]
MSNFGRLLLVNVIVIIVLIGGGALAYYYYDQSTNFVETDNAKIDGQAISVASPAAGKLVDWDAKVGNTYDNGETVGTVATQGKDGKSTKMAIKMPKDATIVQNKGVKDTFVGAGTPIATAYDLNHLFVTANIQETNIDDISKGEKVDVYVDAYPDMTFSGRVEQVGLATQSTFSLMPSQNNSGNYTKVTQVIPVRVSLDNYKGVKLMPGMNVTVKVHI